MVTLIGVSQRSLSTQRNAVLRLTKHKRKPLPFHKSFVTRERGAKPKNPYYIAAQGWTTKPA